MKRRCSDGSVQLWRGAYRRLALHAELTYNLSPALPADVRFNTEHARPERKALQAAGADIATWREEMAEGFQGVYKLIVVLVYGLDLSEFSAGQAPVLNASP